MNQSEIKNLGYKALIESLGVVGILRFLQHLDVGKGDYTKELHSAIAIFCQIQSNLATL